MATQYRIIVLHQQRKERLLVKDKTSKDGHILSSWGTDTWDNSTHRHWDSLHKSSLWSCYLFKKFLLPLPHLLRTIISRIVNYAILFRKIILTYTHMHIYISIILMQLLDMHTVLEVLSYDFDVLENIKHRCREWTYSEGVRMWDDWREQHQLIHAVRYKVDSW